MNEKLNIMNNQLNEQNNQLSETNNIKEHYIAEFLMYVSVISVKWRNIRMFCINMLSINIMMN